ncbi:MAG: ferrochelatase [Planctomycetes bacterium SCN 63-9]|nr:MAG: ferrochelatase [Planctomycetes bacterium SCN 63-9]
MIPYDAILVVGFGGPERREDVMPFLETVTRGRNIPRERLLEVAAHYDHFGGISPINGQVRDLIGALRPELDRREIRLPIYWGNRNWHPLLPATLREMTDAGVKRALALVLAGFSSYSSCRQYREDIENAREAVGVDAPPVDKIRVFYNHPDFIAANAERVASALDRFPAETREKIRLAFTAHSIPLSMARNCAYQVQLEETGRLIAESLGIGRDRWAVVYQSRSGRPQDPWLEPDILDHLNDLKSRGVENVVIHPVGFLSDHIEVLFDLDEEARDRCLELGIRMIRSPSVGTHPRFVSMLAELIEERLHPHSLVNHRAVGAFGPGHDLCPPDCCLPPPRPPIPEESPARSRPAQR